jgi:hypothetical protein
MIPIEDMSIFDSRKQVPQEWDNQGGLRPAPNIRLAQFIREELKLSADEWCSRFESLLPAITNRGELNEAISTFQRNCGSNVHHYLPQVTAKIKLLLMQAQARGNELLLNPTKVTNANLSIVSQESDTQHLFPYKLGTPSFRGGRLEGATPHEVAESFRTLAVQALRDQRLDPQGAVVERYLNNEVGFVRAVVEFYERLKKTTKPVVLWDVDDTLGCIVRVSSREQREEWRFRLSAQSLFGFLTEHYPDVQNGILTARGYKILPLRMDHLGVFSCLDKVFNGELIFSARDLSDHLHQLDWEKRQEFGENALPSEFKGIDWLDLNAAALTKLVALYRLMNTYQENTLHLVDNLAIPVPAAWQDLVLSSAVAEAVWCDEHALRIV